MPAKNPEQRKRYQKNWNTRAVSRGYGKWLYAKRKTIYTDAEKFRDVLEEIMLNEEIGIDGVRLIVSKALTESRHRWKKLGTWDEKQMENDLKQEGSE